MSVVFGDSSDEENRDLNRITIREDDFAEEIYMSKLRPEEKD
jgi:hypothetical protein